MKKPRRLFRERRPASARLESPESVAFRAAMEVEGRTEAVHRMIRLAGFDPDGLDVAVLEEISDLLGCIPFVEGTSALDAIVEGASHLLLIRPRRPCEDHMDFDKAICAAGLKRFVRRTMDSDQPGGGTPLDPSVPVPDVRLGEFILVREISPGIRSRIEVHFNTGATP